MLDTIPTYEKKGIDQRLDYVGTRRLRKEIIDSVCYAVRLNLKAFDYNEDQLLYVFTPHPYEERKDEFAPMHDVREYVNALAVACATGTRFNTWQAHKDADYEQNFALPFMTIVEKTDDHVIYGCRGWTGTTKQFRQFAKDNFKFYRLIKAQGYFGRPSFNIKIESQDLMFKRLTGEMIDRESLI